MSINSKTIFNIAHSGQLNGKLKCTTAKDN